jgi:AIPR protein
MSALSLDYQEILKRELSLQYVQNLPPLLPNTKTPDDNAQKNISRSLSAFVLHSICDISADVASKAVVDDYSDNGIDAIYYDESSETLHIVQSKLKASEEFQQAESQAFCSGLRLIFTQEFQTFNQNFQNRLVKIEAALASASKIKIWIAYTGTRVSDVAKNILEQFVNDDTHGEIDRVDRAIGYFDPEKIREELLNRQSYQPVNEVLTLSHDCKIDSQRTTWYGMARVTDLVALHNKYPKALYEKNIRYFLGSSKSEVNRGIQKTLSNEPESFFYLNNGVTALCNKVEEKGRKASTNLRRLNVRGLSIINGAQTIASAAELMNSANPPDISQAKVMFTLIQASADGTFGPKVTKARNSQNAVSTSNFASQDPQQERLRQELQGLGITYHYRPEALAQPSHTSILLEEALHALAWLQADPRYPIWLKSGKGDTNNPDADAYKNLFHAQLSGAYLANAVYFSRHIKHLIKQADQGSTGTERLVYRHGTHAIGWSYMKRLKNRIAVHQIIDPLTIPALVSYSFDIHRQTSADMFTNNPQIKGPLAYFKNLTDTIPYLVKVMETSYGLQQNPALPALKLNPVNVPFNRYALFAYLTQHALQA